MNKHVNFETAKLLKEKGYFFKTPHFYTTENPHSYHKDKLSGVCILGLLHSETLYKEYTEVDEESGLLKYQLNPSIVHAPTIAETIMWFYEKHGIWIEVQCPDMPTELWSFNIHRFQKYGGYGDGNNFNSPTEAYQEAIKYCLTKLI